MEIVSFETAKILKELGFDEYVLNVYKTNKLRTWHLLYKVTYLSKGYYYKVKGNSHPVGGCKVSAPYLSQVQEWLREKEIEVAISPDFYKHSEHTGYVVDIDIFKDGKHYKELKQQHFKTYNEALKVGIKESLKYLKDDSRNK